MLSKQMPHIWFFSHVKMHICMCTDAGASPFVCSMIALMLVVKSNRKSKQRHVITSNTKEKTYFKEPYKKRRADPALHLGLQLLLHAVIHALQYFVICCGLNFEELQKV